MGMKLKVNMSVPFGLNMSRLRWALAGALAVLALVATVQSMRTYQAHEMTTGVLAVIALAALLLVGLGSLGMARLRIARELASLQLASSQRAPGAATSKEEGELLASRRRRLDSIRAAGARPDRDALAESTRAEEAGRAYIGRYLVATTVLIGLVGTFAGLMQTLGKMAPLFGDKGASDIALLVTPLAGLHVTFGASLVAILSTLALALAQGDLALCEEQALALLEDHTTHDMIPKLWPDSDDAAGRTVKAMRELQETFVASLVKSIEGSLKTMADSTRAQSDRSAKVLEGVATTIEKELARLSATIEGSVDKSVSRQSEALVDATKRQAAALAETTATVAKRVGDAGTSLMTAMQAEAEKVFNRSAKAGQDALTLAATAIEAALSQSTKAGQEALTLAAAAVETAVTRSAKAGQEALALAATAVEAAAARSTKAGQDVLTLAATAGEAAVTRSTQAVEEATRSSRAAIAELARSSAAAIAASTAHTAATLDTALNRSTAAAAESLERATAATENSVQQTTDAVTGALQPFLAEEANRLDAVRASLGELGGRVDVTAGRLVELTAALEGVAREHVTAIERSGQDLLAAFDRAVLGGGAALETAAGTLATAARDLQAGTTTLAPRIGSLTTELGALGREVALLLAARGPDGDIGAVVLGELDRLGAGMERLTELVRLAGGAEPSGPSQPVADAAAPEQALAVETSSAAVSAPSESSASGVVELEGEGEADLLAEPSEPVELPSPGGEHDSAVGEGEGDGEGEGMSAASSAGAVDDAAGEGPPVGVDGDAPNGALSSHPARDEDETAS